MEGEKKVVSMSGKTKKQMARFIVGTVLSGIGTIIFLRQSL